MKRLYMSIVGLLASLMIAGCAVMSQPVRDQAIPPLPFNELVNHVAQYKGQVVILGGYVVSVENLEKQTRIVELQAPLGVGEQPKAKDLSQGRFSRSGDLCQRPQDYRRRPNPEQLRPGRARPLPLFKNRGAGDASLAAARARTGRSFLV